VNSQKRLSFLDVPHDLLYSECKDCAQCDKAQGTAWGYMEDLALIFGSSFIIALSGALMPGPVLAVTITEASRIGLRAGPLIMLGHALLELALFSLLVLGFVHFINHPVVLGVVGVAGGAILLWMSCGMLKSLRTLDLNLEARAVGNSLEPVEPILDHLVGHDRPRLRILVHEVRMGRNAGLLHRPHLC
jgi:hypothetical protein